MEDKIIIITGASDGIGKAAAQLLKKQGATVVIVGHSPEKTKRVARELDVPFYIADFAKLRDVRRLASELKEAYPHIDVLANNAGGIFNTRTVTEDGFEKTMQVNHLAPFLLTNLLLDVLQKSHATIVTTSSHAHKTFARFDGDDLNMKRAYTPSAAYGNAKLENILFTRELQKRYGAHGVSAVCFHPGVVATNFANDTSPMLRFAYHTPMKHIVRMISPEQGADTLVWLASTKPGEDWHPGAYYYKRTRTKTSPIAADDTAARLLWEQSAAMVGLDR